MRNAAILLLAFVVAVTAHAQPLRDVIGVAHIDGKYSVPAQGRDYLSEGAYRIRYELGSRVIKLWLDGNPARFYPFHSPNWQSVQSGGGIVQIADHPYYRQVFTMPFSTFILVVDLPDGVWFQDGMTVQEERAEEEEFYRLARYLMVQYARTGKTFVLQNWEGDWLLRVGDDGAFLPDAKNPQPAAISGMIKWLQARQRGVERARAELRGEVDGVTVKHAIEVNFLRRSLSDPARVSVATHVLPSVAADLYSYSAWESLDDWTGDHLLEMLTVLDEKTPGSGNIYVGEYGVPENVFGTAEHLERVRAYTEAALAWGARYLVYWQIYCNEFAGNPVPEPLNRDMRGFWLIRPDGTRSPVWTYLRGQIARQAVQPRRLLQPRPLQ